MEPSIAPEYWGPTKVQITWSGKENIIVVGIGIKKKRVGSAHPVSSGARPTACV